MRQMIQGRARVLWALIGSITLVMSCGISAAAMEDAGADSNTTISNTMIPNTTIPIDSVTTGPIEGSVGSDPSTPQEPVDKTPATEEPTGATAPSSSPTPETNAAVESPESEAPQEQIAATPIAVTVTMDRTKVKVGESITASWKVTGGSNPSIDSLRFVTEITEGSVLVSSAVHVPDVASPGSAGSVAMAVPDTGNRIDPSNDVELHAASDVRYPYYRSKSRAAFFQGLRYCGTCHHKEGIELRVCSAVKTTPMNLECRGDECRNARIVNAFTDFL